VAVDIDQGKGAALVARDADDVGDETGVKPLPAPIMVILMGRSMVPGRERVSEDLVCSGVPRDFLAGFLWSWKVWGGTEPWRLPRDEATQKP